ncbi:hypothetical protein ACWCPM_32690 [Streptomyces sp. NPDC002309]
MAGGASRPVLSFPAPLHTSPLRVPVLDSLRDEDHSGLELRHLVHEDLLTRARRDGLSSVARARAVGAAGRRGAPPQPRGDSSG